MPMLQKALLDTLATPLCSSKGICAVVGRTVDVLVVSIGAMALLLALVAAGALLLSRRRRMARTGLAAAIGSWLIAPRAMIYPGRSYPSLAQQCQDVADTPAAPKPTSYRVAVLLTVSVCVDGVAEMSGVRQQRARCSSMTAGALAARLRAYRRTLKHWLCFGSLKDVYVVESSNWPLDELFGGLGPGGRRSMCGGSHERPLNESLHLFVHQLGQRRGVGKSPGEAMAVVAAADRFNRRWADSGVTHVLKVTGKYALPQLTPWVRAFERCGCDADVVHSAHSVQPTKLWPWLPNLERWLLGGGGTGDSIHCEVFGLRRELLRPFYHAYLVDEVEEPRQSNLQHHPRVLEEYIRLAVRDRSTFHTQISLPRLPNVLRARRGVGDTLDWL